MKGSALIAGCLLLCACANPSTKMPTEPTADGNYRITGDSDDAVTLEKKLEGGAQRFCEEHGGDAYVIDRDQRTIYRSMEAYHRLTLIYRCEQSPTGV